MSDQICKLFYIGWSKSFCVPGDNNTYRKLQVVFKVSPASLDIIDTPNCVLEDRVRYSTVHNPNVFCDGRLQIIHCVGIVQIHSVFRHTPEKKSAGERYGDLGDQMVVEMILSAKVCMGHTIWQRFSNCGPWVLPLWYSDWHFMKQTTLLI
jgi:hypothetical protein